MGNSNLVLLVVEAEADEALTSFTRPLFLSHNRMKHQVYICLPPDLNLNRSLTVFYPYFSLSPSCLSLALYIYIYIYLDGPAVVCP